MEPEDVRSAGRSFEEQRESDRLVQLIEFRVRVEVGVNRALDSEYLDEDVADPVVTLVRNEILSNLESQKYVFGVDVDVVVVHDRELVDPDEVDR